VDIARWLHGLRRQQRGQTLCDGAPAAISLRLRNILGRRHPGAIDIPPLILARADEVVE
jgi:hypothetical protein